MITLKHFVVVRSVFQSLSVYVFFFGAFAKLRIMTISFVMSVCLSVCLYVCPSAWDNSAPTGRIFIHLNIY